ncbi:MAG: Lactaldehyde dehydrogenase CofA [Candidatus Methanohalarchaeum thermophilum]|uniref:Lactaldehyde dehydrogenase CofA n=1 Tax=Methanohalarchaeum thermophilum TaxID=1903181 RepID=A0A1Q6DXF5_METT1|nr:MAG: Lactaldehyde dehydrogenase CofA [Candidatus Methanohalarchaeum thermophilum]
MRDKIESIDPVSGEVIKSYSLPKEEEIGEIVDRSREASLSWGDTSLAERSEYLGAIREIVVDELENIVDVIQRDTGKPEVEVMMSDVLATLELIKYYENNLEEILSREKRKTPLIFYQNESYVDYEPYGVVLVIAPWNYPFQLALIPTVTALAAGNTVVLKPSEVTPYTGEMIEKVLEQADLPSGVFQVIQGDGEVGEKIIEQEPDKVFLTGAVETGKKVMKKASKNLIPVQLELGGKDPMIVFEDAQIDRAVKGAVYGGLANSGQLCISVERLYVEDSIKEDFTKKLIREVKDLDIGDENSRDFELGPMIREEQIDVVRDQFEDAISKGAESLTEWKTEGRYLFPQVLVNVDHSMKVMKEETFGPLIPVMGFNDEEEAIKLANDSEYGLDASVWSENISKAKRIASDLETGNCYINDVVKNIGNPYLPFGGAKKSGIGHYHGPEGLKCFTQSKSVMINKNKTDEINWFPYTEELSETAKKLIHTQYGDIGFLRKIKNLLELRKKLK